MKSEFANKHGMVQLLGEVFQRLVYDDEERVVIEFSVKSDGVRGMDITQHVDILEDIEEENNAQ